MMARPLVTGVLMLAMVSLASNSVSARDLTFEERVRAETAILKVYHSHTLGPPPPFEQVYPRQVIEERVRRYLGQSLLLERRWDTSIGPEALRAEAHRIAERTRFPQRLQELYDALDGDAFLFEECVARATLVDRLSRSLFAADAGLSTDLTAPSDWNTWWSSVENELAIDEVRAVSTSTGLPEVSTSAFDCSPGDTWLPSSLDTYPDRRINHIAVWTGTVMLVWGGDDGDFDWTPTGLRYDPLTDTWSAMSAVGAPTFTTTPVYAWTGTELIVWRWPSGARYNPSTDTWTPMAAGSCTPYSGVWTGEEFIVCCGAANGCERYDPATDSWTAASMDGSPPMRIHQTAVWTGSEMIVFGGGQSGITYNTGGRYDPDTDSWSLTSTNRAPARTDHTAVWTGDEMIVWGGYESSTQAPAEGARYTPANDRWQSLPWTTSPEGRKGHTAVWTGTEMIVWGGYTVYPAPGKTFGDGGRYDPANNTWTLIPSLAAPSARQRHSAIWDGTRMIVFGGRGQSTNDIFNDGWKYDPGGEVWTPTSSGAAPEPRENLSAVWTGSEMIVWGGSTIGPTWSTGPWVDTGARYDPLLDQWIPTSVVDAPAPRSFPMMIWTGTEAIVWGGSLDPWMPTSSGGRYDPTSDSWSPTSLTGAPEPRSNATMIWTGEEAIVWGGITSSEGPSNTGGRYDPELDQWTPTTLSAAPEPRHSHTAVWAEPEMIVWGGDSGVNGWDVVDTGGLYNPSSDSWTPTAFSGAPWPRFPAVASWNGHEMLVWGGFIWDPQTGNRSYLYTGGLYDPVFSFWSAVPSTGAPSSGQFMKSVALGNEFLVWGPPGRRYDPVAATWRTMTPPNVPLSSAANILWTGDFALFWDGPLRHGGIYAVDTDQDGESNFCDVDDDDDGTPDSSDCAPLDESAASEPVEVEDLVVSKWAGGEQYDWTAQPGVRYDLIVGYLSALTADAGTMGAQCTAQSLNTNSWVATHYSGWWPTPPAGDGFYILTRARNVCGLGTYGVTTYGVARAADLDCR